MCRSLEQGGRRCASGHSSTRAAQAARQRLCRARKALAAAEVASGQASAAATPAGIVEARVRVAFDAATKTRPDYGGDQWMSLTKLRGQMSDVPRADLDAVLDRMLTGGQARLMAELNQKTLTQEDRAAAIDIADEPRHLIGVNPDQAASAQAALAVAKQRVKDAEHDVTSLKQDAEQDMARTAVDDVPTQTAASAAADLGVSIGTLYKWLKTGEIRNHGVTGHKENGCWVITLLDDTSDAADVEAQIRAAYTTLTTRPGAWVSLTDLRPLVHASRGTVDAALRQLERRPDVNLVPESNQKALAQEDRDAAVNIGEQDKHLIWIQQ